MKFLLDTHAFIFWMLDSPELPRRVRSVMATERTMVAFSVLSAWEIAIKTSLGKLSGVPLDDLADEVRAQGFSILRLELDHVQALTTLPQYHADPFDRGLIASALSENLTLITRDGMFDRYAVRTFWE